MVKTKPVPETTVICYEDKWWLPVRVVGHIPDKTGLLAQRQQPALHGGDLGKHKDQSIKQAKTTTLSYLAYRVSYVPTTTWGEDTVPLIPYIKISVNSIFTRPKKLSKILNTRFPRKVPQPALGGILIPLLEVLI
jgi:hypothetical protein